MGIRPRNSSNAAKVSSRYLAPYASGRDPRGEWPCSELGGRQDAVNPRLRLPQAVKDELLAAGHRLHQDLSERDPEVKHRA